LDSSGNKWLFGGIGYDSTGNQSFLNDLWEYSAGQWIWVSGSDTANAAGTYGTRGVASLGSAPGARLRALTWTDSSGNLWLFGGLGFDSNGAQGALNDLWEYAGGLWTWVGGADTINASGAFGTKGMAAPTNAPGARYASICWADPSGKIWLFGGQTFDSSGNPVFLNDLWRFDGGQWTWVSGSNLANGSGSYGTPGTAAVANLPGARYASVGWVDSLGSLWLFGGAGYDEVGSQGGLNDLWTYTP
jgi:N-acetylneuraminic acid mutarotase